MDTTPTIAYDASVDDHEIESLMQPENRNNSSNDIDDHDRTTTKLLRACASSISRDDTSKVRRLLWMLNELASPYGDRDEKLAYYFLQALLCKAMDSGCYRRETLISVAEKNCSFDSVRRRMLKFQEVSPWTTFGHVASNGAMLEAFEGELKLHIIDISNIHTMCTQWPTFLESLATRSPGETPALKLTVVVAVESTSFMKEITPRIEKFARLMGVRPFEFTVITSGVNRLEELTKEGLGVQEDEAVAVNCIGALTRVDVAKRNAVIQMIRSLRPKIVTVVEEEADFSTSRDGDFVERFDECLRFYTIYFDMLEESFGVPSTEKLVLERECSRSIVRALACDDKVDDQYGGEVRERGSRWSERLREMGFSPIAYSHDVVDDVRALLERYKAGWSSLVAPGEGGGGGSSGIYMAWKEVPVVWASVWKPSE